MGKHDVTVYTCDGCYVKESVKLGGVPSSFKGIVFNGKDTWLCETCYRAVQWVVKYQNVIVPPKVYKNDRGYGLRKKEER